jgi:recombination protein RecA
VSNFAKALAEITKAYGPGALKPASSVKPLKRIPTGVFGLDAMLGGGIPLSRVTEFVGEPSGGKSTIAQLAISHAQLIDRRTFARLERTEDGVLVDPATGEVGEPMRAVWIDSEGTFDASWAGHLGVDVEALYYAPASYLEQAFDMVVALIRTGEVDLIVLDSIAALAPASEVEHSMEDQQMGVAARGNNKGLRKLTAEFNRLVQTQDYAPAVVLINQMREKIGVMFGDPTTSPGGRGQEFFATLRVKFWPEALSKAKKDGDDIVARVSKFKIEKNKLNGIYGDGVFTLYVRDYGDYRRGDTDSLAQVVDWAVRLGVFEVAGSHYTMPDGEKLHGRGKVEDYLKEHPHITEQIRDEVFERVRS